MYGFFASLFLLHSPGFFHPTHLPKVFLHPSFPPSLPPSADPLPLPSPSCVGPLQNHPSPYPCLPPSFHSSFPPSFHPSFPPSLPRPCLSFPPPRRHGPPPRARAGGCPPSGRGAYVLKGRREGGREGGKDIGEFIPTASCLFITSSTAQPPGPSSFSPLPPPAPRPLPRPRDAPWPPLQPQRLPHRHSKLRESICWFLLPSRLLLPIGEGTSLPLSLPPSSRPLVCCHSSIQTSSPASLPPSFPPSLVPQVVNKDLCVDQVLGLRVADASILPRLGSAGPLGK